MKIVEITSCDQCPHHVEFRSHSECSKKSPAHKIRFYGEDNFPNWCPLANVESREKQIPVKSHMK